MGWFKSKPKPKQQSGPTCPTCGEPLTPHRDWQTGGTRHDCHHCGYTTLYAKDAEREIEQETRG